MKKQTNKNELEKVKAGAIMSAIVFSGGLIFIASGFWIAAVVVFALLAMILIVSYISSLFPKRHSKEYNSLNPLQKTFASSAYVIELFGYTSSIG